MAAVTFTRKAASELRGRFHLALEESWSGRAPSRRASPRTLRVSPDCGRRCRIWSASSLEPFTRSARASAGAPGRIGRVPGFHRTRRGAGSRIAPTILAGFHHERARCRRFRHDRVAPSRPPAGSGLGVREDLRERGRGVSAGAAVCPIRSRPGRRWTFWRELQKYLPSSIDPDTSCRIQQAVNTFRGQLRVSRRRLERPAVVASLLATWDRESKIIQNRWADSRAGKKRLAALIETLHGDFRTSVVEPYLAQWRQYVYRLAIGLLTRARASAASERRRLNSLNYADLLHLTARVLRENVGVRRRCSRSSGICSWTSSRTPIRSRPRLCSGSQKTPGASPPRPLTGLR